jgi:hypothetical protein
MSGNQPSGRVDLPSSAAPSNMPASPGRLRGVLKRPAMISQTAPEGEPHFVLTMADHTEMCGQMARAFGNDRFEPLSPFDEVVYIVENHDRGWEAYDANPGLDPATGVPYIMARTPAPDAVKTNRGSPDFNEARHRYCGLLSSMHSWGLYNGRYGFSRYVIRTQGSTSLNVVDVHRPLIEALLAFVVARLARLTAVLAADPATRAWIERRHLFQNYKQLQFFDTMSLYFHLRHADERGEESYIHVPLSADADTTVTLRKIDDSHYSLDPFPFAGDLLTIVCKGRYVMPFPRDFPPERVGAALRELPQDQQTYNLLPA